MYYRFKLRHYPLPSCRFYSAADKVNNLNFVAIADFGLLPFSAPYYLPINLNSNSLRRQR